MKYICVTNRHLTEGDFLGQHMQPVYTDDIDTECGEIGLHFVTMCRRIPQRKSAETMAGLVHRDMGA